MTDDADIDGEAIQVWIDENHNGEYNHAERNRTYNSSDGMTINDTFGDVSLSAGSYRLMAVENATMNGGADPNTTDIFDVDDTPPSMQEAVAYTETGGTQAYGDIGDIVIEVQFDENLSDGSSGTAPDGDDFRIGLENGSDRRVTVNEGGTGDKPGDKRVALRLDGNARVHDIASVAVIPGALFTDTAGNAANAHEQSVISTTRTIAEDGENTSVWKGERVAIVGDEDDEQVEVQGSRTGGIVDTGTGATSRILTFTTESRSTTQDYQVAFDNRTDPNLLLGDVGFNLSDLGLSVRVNNTLVNSSEEIEVITSANAPNRTVFHSLLDSDGATVSTQTASLNESGVVTVTFESPEPGDYTVSIEDHRTGFNTTSDTVTVFTVSTPESTATTRLSPTSTSSPVQTSPGSPGPTSTPTETESPTTRSAASPSPDQNVTQTDSTSPSPTDTTQPGFGKILTGLALVGAIALRRRIR